MFWRSILPPSSGQKISQVRNEQEAGDKPQIVSPVSCLVHYFTLMMRALSEMHGVTIHKFLQPISLLQTLSSKSLVFLMSYSGLENLKFYNKMLFSSRMTMWTCVLMVIGSNPTRISVFLLLAIVNTHSLSLWLCSPFDLGHFFSFLILYTVYRTPWTRDQPIERPLSTHRTTETQNKHIYKIHALSGIRTHDSSHRSRGKSIPERFTS
jgi:hypothetical protein